MPDSHSKENFSQLAEQLRQALDQQHSWGTVREMAAFGEERYYREVLQMLEEGSFPETRLPIWLKNSKALTGVTPYRIGRDKERPDTLMLYYYEVDEKRFASIPVAEIAGLNVVRGEGEYADELLVEFTYYKPTPDGKQFLESKPRKLLVYEIRQGFNKDHWRFGEKPDFYLVGEDVQYAQEPNKMPKEKRGRQFPFWRVNNMYGGSRQVEPDFKRKQS